MSEVYLKSHLKSTCFIFEVWKRLSLSSTSLFVSCAIYHRFYRETKEALNTRKLFEPSHQKEILGATAVYLASKIEEESLKIRDVVNVCYRVLHPDDLPLEIGEKYWHLRDSILNCELYVLRVLKFRVSFDTPHKYLLSYLNSLKSWIDPSDWAQTNVSQLAWNLLQDSFHLPLSVERKPGILSLAILKLAVDCANLKISAEGAAIVWWQAFSLDVKESTLHDVAKEVLQVSEFEFICGMPGGTK